jgi:hypothetical protein
MAITRSSKSIRTRSSDLGCQSVPTRRSQKAIDANLRRLLLPQIVSPRFRKAIDDPASNRIQNLRAWESLWMRVSR